MGVATFEFRGRKYYYTITISSKIFTKDCVSLKETVYHEVAHIADWQIYRKWGHGETWTRLMYRLGVEPKIFIDPHDYEDAGYSKR